MCFFLSTASYVVILQKELGHIDFCHTVYDKFFLRIKLDFVQFFIMKCCCVVLVKHVNFFLFSTCNNKIVYLTKIIII